MVSRYSARASSLVLNVTDSTSSQPSILVWSALMSSSLALSETNAWMVTWSSTVPTMPSSSTEPMANRPMMNSDRKIVTTAPNVVEPLRTKWCPASRIE